VNCVILLLKILGPKLVKSII